LPGPQEILAESSENGKVEVDSIPAQTHEKSPPIDSADLVASIPSDLNHDGVATMCGALRALPGSPRVVVLHRAAVGEASASIPQAPDGNTSLSLVPWSLFDPDLLSAPQQSISAACQSLFAVSERLGARGCCLAASKMESASPKWICQLVQPLLDADFHLVVPRYAPRHLQGLLNSSICYPLMRSLYGKRTHDPLGPDVGVSRQLAQKILGSGGNSKPGLIRTHPLASLVPMAVVNNLQVCEAQVGARVYPPTDWANLSSRIIQVLSPIFLDMERSVAYWQKTRGSIAVPARGERLSVDREAESLDINRMVETFQLGVRDLQEIWSLVLPPATLLELRKLSRVTAEQIRMTGGLWARIVYDFALAHRLRTINRDHLLRSMTPLYLAWVVSYARELGSAGAANIEQRIERLALTYEAEKPYLVSRWRWPDRFNP
jgi:glucosylglycerate synthase